MSTRRPDRARVTRSCAVRASLLAIAAGCASPPAAAQPPPATLGPPAPPASTVRLVVDATDAPRHLLRAQLVLAVRPGPLTLAYPKWIPGEHGPTGPIVNLAGLVMRAGAKPVAWRRDSERLYEFHLDVPSGATTLEIELEFLDPS
jgi:Peptidase M61 N-terminal domain